MRWTPRVDLTHKRANQQLLASLLRRKAEILEIPVRFFPLSPERVKRTSALDGPAGAVDPARAAALAAASGREPRRRYAGDAAAGTRPAK